MKQWQTKSIHQRAFQLIFWLNLVATSSTAIEIYWSFQSWNYHRVTTTPEMNYKSSNNNVIRFRGTINERGPRKLNLLSYPPRLSSSFFAGRWWCVNLGGWWSRVARRIWMNRREKCERTTIEFGLRKERGMAGSVVGTIGNEKSNWMSERGMRKWKEERKFSCSTHNTHWMTSLNLAGKEHKYLRGWNGKEKERLRD